MSPPTLNRRPSARRSTARVSRGGARSAWGTCSASAGSSALPASGRSSVIRQTSPSTSVCSRGRSSVPVIAVLPPVPACRPPYGVAGGRASGAAGRRVPAVLGLQLLVDRARGAAELVGDLTGDPGVPGGRGGGHRGVGASEHPVPGAEDRDAEDDGAGPHEEG